MSNLLGQLSEAIVKGLQTEVVVCFKKLVDLHPGSWRTQLSRIDAFPDPSVSRISIDAAQSRCGMLRAALPEILDAGYIDLDSLKWLLSFTTEYLRSLRTIIVLREQLSSIAFFKDSVSTQTFRLGVLIENQSRSAFVKIHESAKTMGFLNPLNSIEATLPTLDGGSTNIVGSYEALVESAELILRYSHYKMNSQQNFGALSIKSPFEDSDVMNLFYISAKWRVLNEEMSAVRYSGWSSHIDTNHACYVPGDISAYICWEISKVRDQQIGIQFHSEKNLLAGYPDQETSLNEFARSITLPEAGTLWNGEFSKELFATQMQHSIFCRTAEDWAKLKHLSEYADSLRIDDKALSWLSWLKAAAVLQSFSFAISRCAHVDSTTIPPDLLSCILVVSRVSLISLFTVAGLDSVTATEAVNALTFSQKHKSLELWDMPLLPIEEDKLLLVPGLICNANPTRMLENAVRQWGDNSNGAKGSSFEYRIFRIIEDSKCGKCKRNVKFSGSKGDIIECDLVWWWGDYLFLIEAKCMPSISSHAEYALRRSVVIEALSQLKRRREEIHSNWNSFRRSASECDLPVECPRMENVITVAVSNVTAFSGWKTKDGVVTDMYIFNRYFEDPEITAALIGESASKTSTTKIGMIRNGDPSPTGFSKYLEAPIQCEVHKSAVNLDMVYSCHATDAFPVWKLQSSYQPPEESNIINMVGKLFLKHNGDSPNFT